MAQKIFCNILVAATTTTLLLLLLLLPLSADARPSSAATGAVEQPPPVDPSEYHGNLSPETIRKVQQCEKDIPTMELCMRCAKVTKSDIVYPICCSNDDGIKDWCQEYVFYGIE